MPLSKIKIYLAGSVRTRERWDFDRFEKAAQALRDHGALVHSQVETGLHEGYFPDDEDEVYLSDLESLCGVVALTLAKVLVADAVALLPGWEESGEAAAVKALAELRGIPVVRYEDLLLVS
jgi:hypothetical protein